MPAVADDDDEQAEPRALMHRVAHGLAVCGFKVSEPDDGESRRLVIISREDTNCDITVNDYGNVAWYYSPLGGRTEDPAKVTRLVMNAFGRPANNHGDWNAIQASDLPLLSITGRTLKAAGLNVCLEVYGDQTFYEVSAEIVVTNPSDPGRGAVHVDDQGGIVWEFWCQGLKDVDASAGQIVKALTGVLAEVARQ